MSACVRVCECVRVFVDYSPAVAVPCRAVLFQVSLLHLAEITEEGVKFQSPMDGSEMLLTPEMSMALQNQVRAARPRGAACPSQACISLDAHSDRVSVFRARPPPDRLRHHDGARRCCG